MIILGTNSIKDTGFDVANSCRFNDDDTAYLHKTPSGAGNRQKFTLSCWLKKSSGGTEEILVAGVNNTNYTRIGFEGGDELKLFGAASSSTVWEIQTQAKFRDFSAWYNFVFAFDTTQGTASDRIKIYVNGVRVTPSSGFGDETYPSQNYSTNINYTEKHRVGIQVNDSGGAYDGYMSEVVLIDNAQLDATSFGEFDDSGIWKPIDVSGLTAGTNGFYLDFEDSSNLGNDVFGGTDLTEVNLAATDQSTDTCTNNFCTMNPLENYYQAATLTEGNLKLLTATSSNTAPSLATFALTKGKWYYEAKYVSDSLAASSGAVGIVGTQVLGATNSAMLETAQKYGLYLNDGDIWHNNSKVQELGSHIDHTATIGISLDFDNNRITFSKDGGWGDGSGNWDEAAPNTFYTVAAPSTVDFGAYFPAFGDWSSGSIGYEINFGCPMYAISSSNSDANGYGNFEYAVPSGHFAICTKNLAEYG